MEYKVEKSIYDGKDCYCMRVSEFESRWAEKD